MAGVALLVTLGAVFGIAKAAGASFGWATGLAWAAGIAVFILVKRLTMYRAYARSVMQTPEYKENERRADEFFNRR